MSKRMTGKRLLILSLAGFLCTALSFPLMPNMREEGLLQVLPGLLFWAGLLLGIGSQISLSAQRKHWAEKEPERGGEIQKRLPGALCFFQNTEGKISDIALAISVTGLAVCFAARVDGLFVFLFMGLTFFSFCTHCIYNGKNILYIKELETYSRARKKGRRQDGRVG